MFARVQTRPIPRVVRMMKVARDLGYSPVFLGSVRDQTSGRRDDWDGFPVERIGEPFPLLNGRGLVAYVRGVSSYNAALYKQLKAIQPAIVHASDVETMAASLLYCKSRRIPLLYNVHDNFADRYALPRPIRRVLNVFEGLLVRLSTVAMVPEPFRRDSLPRWARGRVRVIRNTPVDIGFQPPRDRTADPRVRVVYVGWLDDGRGIDHLLDLVERHDRLDVRIAGDGDSALVARIKESSATYLGYLNHEQALEATSEADYVIAPYDPVRPINRYAAPNKLAEALCVGRPVIINSEVLVGHQPELNGCLISVPYAELSDIGPAILADYEDQVSYEQKCRDARAAYEQLYSWTAVEECTMSAYSEALGDAHVLAARAT